MAALTQRQLEFARCVGLRNMSLIDAYRAAGYSQKCSDKAQHDNAGRLSRNAVIRQEIDRYIGQQAAPKRESWPNPVFRQ